MGIQLRPIDRHDYSCCSLLRTAAPLSPVPCPLSSVLPAPRTTDLGLPSLDLLKQGTPGPLPKKRKRGRPANTGNTSGLINNIDESDFPSFNPTALWSTPSIAMSGKLKSPITCHVLDSTAGRPGANIKIRMDQLGQTGFTHVATGETDGDGRDGVLLPGTKLDKNSIFKLTFYTKEYFLAQNKESFYPFVEVVFEIKEPSEHHHIALLLSPFSYTTYRGS